MGSSPTRIDGDLFLAAQAVAQTQSRSAAQQIDHWARIGRELEASPRVTNEAVRLVLAGQASYDTLSEESQAVVRATWEERIAEQLDRLNLTAELTAVGDPWVEGDAAGEMVVRRPRSTRP
ncbi:TA system antitoxin ParD family protein [Humibacter sp.]|jgi:hypothetical protein|uniref:TA system antitoxin ParD family protein n=1 Tax=Humibacter sp. TaxID=1940291 RepID=UPI002BB892DD|nr:hypothetical protein [Humibacter sp.]HVX08136.1 hypothetical protein [Humibacter sp.]